MKVATFTRDIFRKSKKIYLVICSHPEGCTPKQISSETGLNVNTIKSILPKMENIKKVSRGLYLVVNEGDTPPLSTLENWNFHNCILSYNLNLTLDNIITKTETLGLFKYEFIISKSGNCTLRLSTEYPMNVSSINLAASIFQHLISDHVQKSIPLTGIEVKTIEFNQDYANLRLDGVQSITLDSLNNQFKLYQKSVGLRVEHKTKVKFKANDLIEVLKTKPNELELGLRLNKQKEQLDRLTTNVSNMTKVMFRMIDKMNEGMNNAN